MTDIFFSYASTDRAAIIPIVAALQDEGYSVWWDREQSHGLRPGDDFDLKIEAELTTAKCVIVCWSTASRVSQYVRDEARDAKDRGVLVPISISAVKPPLGFRSLHTEDLSDWEMNLQHKGWVRLVLQVASLAGTDVLRDSTRSKFKSSDVQNAKIGGMKILFGMFGLFLFYFVFHRDDQFDIFGSVIGIALLAFLLFRQADYDLRPQMRALATTWLLPRSGKLNIRTTTAFLKIFEAVFSRDHFSWKCWRRSAFASFFSMVIAMAVIDTSVQIPGLMPWSTPYPLIDYLQYTAYIILVAGIANVVGDCISLFETRLILNICNRQPETLILGVFADIFLTFLVFAIALCIGVFIYSIVESNVILSVSETALLVFATIKAAFMAFDQGDARHPDFQMGAAIFSGLATAYITSIWLWLALIFTPAFRLVLWSRTTGLRSLGVLFNVQQKPFTALEFVTAGFVMMTGLLASLAQRAFA